MTTAPNAARRPRQPFPRSFWIANLTELFERGAYYAMASFAAIYFGQLGMGGYWPSFFNSVLLWGLVYFLPIISGTIADQIGFRRALLGAFGLLAAGYFLLGYPIWFGGYTLSEDIKPVVTADGPLFAIITCGIVLIGMGGSVIKPCISGTVQKTAGKIDRATLGFGIFYMVINIGSLVGRGMAFGVRKAMGLSTIFAVSIACSAIAFLVVLLVFRDPVPRPGEGERKKSVGRILLDMVRVLRNPRFDLFLLFASGFFFVYCQVYNVIPLYLKRVVDLDPPMDVITMANPTVIVCFQLVVTRLFGKWRPISSIIVGTVIIGLAMLINLIPIVSTGGLRQLALHQWVPVAFVYATLCVGAIAIAELFTSPRMYEYIGRLAPKGQEGLFLGYANLPMAIGTLTGGPIGAVIFNKVMCRHHTVLPSKLLELDPTWNAIGWLMLLGVAMLSAACMWRFNLWLKRYPEPEAAGHSRKPSP